ncbi:MAG: MerR family transcriptional regulator [Candidatus Calescibacterium sp.]|nr:MerR family transcriptional regulator [Candidatus Calescibacterium sp.]MCX7971632.1 MerR family transcriptional regulator [bacterium]MDW8195840.1 MerR family transcriptional regulator [Candidatus Calescibacterium sp.]
MVEKIIKMFLENYPLEGNYFSIRTVSEILKIHEQTIRNYEKQGLIKPSRTPTGRRMYNLKDIARLKIITSLSKDMGINTPGIEVIMKLLEEIEQLKEKYEKKIQELEAKINYYHQNYGEIGIVKYESKKMIKER